MHFPRKFGGMEMTFRHKNTPFHQKFPVKTVITSTYMKSYNFDMKKQKENEKTEFDSRKKSALETITDVVLGFLIFVPVNYLVLPLFVDQIAGYDLVGMLTISAIFTSISLVRKYAIRRWFENHRLVLSEKKIWIINNINPKRFVRNLLEKLGGLKN